MPKQNHFSGATLAEAMRNATGAYRKTNAPEAKSFCSNLISQYDGKRSELDRIEREIADLQGRIEDLQRSAARANLLALILAAGTAARAITKWRGILNVLKRFKLDKNALDALLRNGPEASTAASAAASALFGINDYSEAEPLKREVSRLQARSDRIVEQLEDLARSYLNGNCHLGDLQS